MKRSITGLLILISLSVQSQSFPSPAEFLGYKLGDRFTSHYQIVSYFRQAAVSYPARVKVEQYGETYEGRSLLTAVISSQENMAKLEDIRKNNLRMAGVMTDMKPVLNQPVIVWLSYNVHGNEPGSSEVAMQVLYDLLTARDPRITEWLKSAVVIIDPCLNPDGRDRYVNWYNQVVGKHPNANPDAREHDEPWPGGRTNHYNFDLNRDWAWQTQLETQERLKIYNQWLPEIHVDFHEQYPGNPYYFAPAAEPFHEVITPFQRSFQTEIGKNHAKLFDAKGWLYFTREYFDLFYPAYGDTYPLFNGSIGMTYEQAGHSVAGLSYALGDYDTLTLAQRIEHHYTTSMSTIETASKNASVITAEFRKYFEDGVTNGSGVYKSYVLDGSDAGKVSGLIKLFERNQIQFGYAGKPGTIRGYNYFSGKEESYTVKPEDIVISGNQPKAKLLRVLFEPLSKLSDSATYDITAWAIPYAWGVQTYASRVVFSVSDKAPAITPFAIDQKVYGYLVKYSSFADGRLLAQLLSNNIKTRFAEKEFVYDNKKFDKGTLVILRSGNESNWNLLQKFVNDNHNQITPVLSGYMQSGFDFGSDKLHLLRKPVVALLSGKGTYENAAGEVWHLFEQQLNYPVTLINVEDLPDVALKNYDVLIIPDGNYGFLSDKETSVTLKSWIRQGGKLIALQNAVQQMSSSDWGIKTKKKEDDKADEKAPTYDDLKKYGNRDRESLVNAIPGAIFRIELDNSHPLAFGYPDYYFVMKNNTNIYEFMKNDWNVGVFKKNNQVSGFVGSKAKLKIEDGTSIAVQQMAKGCIIYFADDPLFRSFWENGKLLFTNAVFLVGQ